MAEDSHATPLAPVKIYPRSEQEFGTSNTKQKKVGYDRRRRSSKCFVYLLLAFVLLSIALLVFAAVVLRVRSPQMKLGMVEIQNLQSTIPWLNITMVAEIAINNTNYGRFQFQNSSTSILYGNTTVGSTKIDGGRVKARETARVSVTVQVRSATASVSLAENSNFSSDIEAGLVKLSSYAQVRGEVRVVKIITRNTTSVMNCSMSLNLTSQAIQDLQCL